MKQKNLLILIVSMLGIITCLAFMSCNDGGNKPPIVTPPIVDSTRPVDTIKLPGGKDSIIYDTVKKTDFQQRLSLVSSFIAKDETVIITDAIEVPLTTNPDTNAEVFQNALDNSPPYTNLKLPKGDYAFSRTIQITKPVQIYGYSMNGTVLHFYNNAGGIHVGKRCNSSISNLTLVADQIKLSEPTHGLEAESIVEVRNVTIKYFSGHGVYVHAKVQENSDASMSTFSHVYTKENRQHGFYMEGPDANGMNFIACNAMDNYGIGFYDNSGLGNSFYGTMAHANIKGNYKVEASGVRRSNFFGCYSENPSNGVKDYFGSVSYLFGGTWGESGDSYELHDHSKAFND